jgi:hypothetical protein
MFWVLKKGETLEKMQLECVGDVAETGQLALASCATRHGE